MAKLIEYDVTGVEESQGGTGVKVKPGVRIARIEKCEQRTEKKDGTPANDIRVALNFGSEYDWGFTHIGLGEASDWKLAEFVRALKLKDKGKLDPEKQIGKFLRVKVNSGTYEGEYSPDMGKLMPPQNGDEKTWEEGNGSVSELSSKASAGPDTDEEEPEAGETGFVPFREGQVHPSDNEEVASYDDWTDEDLEAEVSDRGLTLPGGRASKKNKCIAALRADDEAAGTEAEAEPEGEAEGNEDDDYDTWDLDQLKADWEARQLGDFPVVRGRNAAERLKAEIIEELRKDDKANPFEA